MHARRDAAHRGRVRHRRTFRRADLAHAIEKEIVILARHVLADERVAERHVLTAKMRGGFEEAVRGRRVTDHQ